MINPTLNADHLVDDRNSALVTMSIPLFCWYVHLYEFQDERQGLSDWFPF